ncbi:MAG: hypothetical protein ACTHU0_10305 [Kofleriaceae bacterium]
MGGNKTGTEATSSIERWESALRVRCAIIAQKLVDLTIAERDLLDCRWPSSAFASASDLSTYVSSAVRRAKAAYRSDRRRNTGTEALHAVVAAESSIDAIGREPAVVAFLLWGSSVEAERFRLACRMLAVLLDVSPATESPRLPNMNERPRAQVGR